MMPPAEVVKPGCISPPPADYPVSRDVLREIATQFRNWVVNRSTKWGAPILDAPDGRRDEFVQRYFKAVKPDQVVCILKAREPARIMCAIGSKKEKTGGIWS